MDEEEERKKKSGVAPMVAPPAKLGILGMKKGGSASSRADGIATKGKTRGTMITMCGGGMSKRK
jgi:hypothetical protein